MFLNQCLKIQNQSESSKILLYHNYIVMNSFFGIYIKFYVTKK